MGETWPLRLPGPSFRGGSHPTQCAMPALIPHPCKKPGCPNTTTATYCEKHRRYRPPRPREYRPNASRRGYTWSWQKARRLFLKDHPLCVRCLECQRTVPATVVDHVSPHKGDPFLFWDRANWQALCKHCHDQKTAREDRGTAWY